MMVLANLSNLLKHHDNSVCTVIIAIKVNTSRNQKENTLLKLVSTFLLNQNNPSLSL